MATWLGRRVLRGGAYPGRALTGAVFRRRARQRGGSRFAVHTADGVTLDAWHAPAREARPDRLPILVMHGWLEVKEFYLGWAYRLNEAGHDVVLFDHRGHGRSQKTAATFGVRERHDAAAVIDTAQALGYVGDRVITLGHSMGAATALQHAAIDPRVAGVVAFAPFSTLDRAVTSFRMLWAPWVNEDWLQRGVRAAATEAGFATEQADTLEAVRELDRPVLLIEGATDRALPPETHTRLIDAAHGNGHIRLHTIPNANHFTLTRKGWPGLAEAVTGFCAEVSEATERR